MNRFHAVLWIQFSRALSVLQTAQVTENEPLGLDAETLKALKEAFGGFQPDCRAMGMDASAITIQKILDVLDQPAPGSAMRMLRLTQELQGRLDDEMGQAMYLSFTSTEAFFYDAHEPFGSEVAASFPSISFDIEEASKCRVLDRSTACVFHLMRAVEAVLRAAGTALGMPALNPQANPTWQRVLDALGNELRRPVAQQSMALTQDRDFYAGLTGHLYAVKTAWRNPTMHVGEKYTPSEALDIWQNVSSLLRHAAKRLHQ